VTGSALTAIRGDDSMNRLPETVNSFGKVSN